MNVFPMLKLESGGTKIHASSKTLYAIHRQEYCQKTKKCGEASSVVAILENEVLAHWSGEVRDFLIQTSFLDKLFVSVCSAVTGNENSAGAEGRGI